MPEVLSIALFLLGVLTGICVFYASIRLSEKPARTRTPRRKADLRVVKSQGSAKNAIEAPVVANAATDFQKIKTATIEIPVIAATVLHYEPGEIAAFPDGVDLYYTPEALKDPEYLETVARSPIQIETHEKNTSEHNRGPDGWPRTVRWDEMSQRVMVNGILHGEASVEYAKENKDQPGFGTSAYISFIEVDRAPGTTPTGIPYQASVRKAANNHIAILPGIRDKNNVIVAMNAVNAGDIKESGFWKIKGKSDSELEELKKKGADFQKEWAGKSYEERLKALGLKNAHEVDEHTRSAYGINIDETPSSGNPKNAGEKKMPIDKEEFKNAMRSYNEEKAAEDKELEGKMAALLEKDEGANKGKNAEEEKAAENARNEAEKKKEAENAAKNAVPSQAMIKDFSDGLGITFQPGITVHGLAEWVGVETKDKANHEIISALNAKRDALKKPTQATVAANATEHDPIKSMSELLKAM